MAGGVVGVVAFAAIGGVLFGLDQGNWGGAVVKEGFVRQFCAGSAQACHAADALPPAYAEFLSLGSSLLQLGAAVGALLLAPRFAESQGRRETMCLGSLITIAGAVPQSLLTDTRHFLLARFVAGAGVGVVTYALPMFVSEIAPAHLRGALGCSMQLTMVAGTVAASLLNCWPDFSYQFSFAMPAVPALVIALGIFSFPTSPRFALARAHRRGNIDDGVEPAWKALRQLRGSDGEADDELAEIRADLLEAEAEASWRELVGTPSLRRRLLVANMLQWLQQFTGVNAILSYGPAIFQAAGVPLSGLQCAVLTNLFNFAATFAMMLVIDVFGRRKILLFGACCMAALMAVSAYLAYLLDSGALAEEARRAVGWGLVASVCLYMASFAIAWGGVPWVYPSEIFPMAAKEKALSTSVCSQWVANFLIAYVVPQQVQAMRVWGTFAFYACCLVGNVLLVYFLVPETKGLALEEMGALFGEEPSTAAEALDKFDSPVSEANYGRQMSGSACSLSFADLMAVATPMTRRRADTAPNLDFHLMKDDEDRGELPRPRSASDANHVRQRGGGLRKATKSFGSRIHMAPLGGVALF